MSKISLNAIAARLEQGTVEEFNNRSSAISATLYISPDLISSQVFSKLSASEVSRPVKTAVPKLAEQCYNTIRQSASSDPSLEVNLYGNGITITASSSANNFKKLQQLTRKGTVVLAKKLNAMLDKSGLESIDRAEFDIGHHRDNNNSYGFASEKEINKFLSTASLPDLKYAIQVSSSFNAAYDKKFILRCIVDSKTDPNSKKKLEKAFIHEAKEYIARQDWVNQSGGSDSKADQIRKSLINSAVKKGAKGKVSKVSRSTTSTSRKGSIRRRTRPTRFDAELNDLKVQQNRSYASLLEILNAKLPEAVKANMTGNRLINRTGRLAESVRATYIDQTPQGYPRINYTYQRSPYDVFDPVLGKPPLNRPGRDPKALVDASIRDIARQLAIGRFYTRRA